MRLLVTGGAGHLGANLVRRLLEGGHPGATAIRAFYLPDASHEALDGLDLERAPGDLRDVAAVERAMQDVDAVYHCAAQISTLPGREREIFECNVVGTRNVLEAAARAGVQRVVVSGSFSAVGQHGEAPSDETVPFYPFQKHLPYSVTKHQVEHECWRAAARGLEVVVATSCAILGPADYVPSRMGQTLVDFAHAKMPAYIPGGFEFVTARDIVAGHLLAMHKGRSGYKYTFGSGYTTVDELMQHFEDVTGTPKPKLRLPTSLMMAIARTTSPILTRFFPKVPQRLTPDAVRLLSLGRRADCTLAKMELGFQPTPVRDAIQLAYEDFVRRGVIRPGKNAPKLDAVAAPPVTKLRSSSPSSVGEARA